MFDEIINPVLRYGYKYGLFIGFVSIYWISGILSYSELERYPISINVNVCIVSFYAFSRELSFHQNSNTVWTSTIVPGLISWNKKMTTEEESCVWQQKQFVNVLKREVFRVLYDLLLQSWTNDIYYSSINYRIPKSTHCFEQYMFTLFCHKYS